jgi:ketosteroid isomerase-like protein
MSTELVRHAYDAWNWYGVDHLRQYLTDDVVLEDAPETPDAHVTRGLDAALERLAEVGEATGGGWVEIHAIEPCGDGFLVTMTWKLDSAAGGATLGEVFHLVDVRGERIGRIRVFTERPGR